MSHTHTHTHTHTQCVFGYLVSAIPYAKTNSNLKYAIQVFVWWPNLHKHLTLRHTLGCKYFRSAELILLLPYHVTIGRRRCLTNYFPSGDSFLSHPQNSHGLSNNQPSQHQLKPLLYQMLPNLRKSIALRKVPRLGPFVLLVTAKCRSRRVWLIGGLLIVEKTKVLWEKLAPQQLCSPQNSYGLTWDRTRASAVCLNTEINLNYT